jgi:hypothetical protein
MEARIHTYIHHIIDLSYTLVYFLIFLNVLGIHVVLVLVLLDLCEFVLNLLLRDRSLHLDGECMVQEFLRELRGDQTVMLPLKAENWVGGEILNFLRLMWLVSEDRHFVAAVDIVSVFLRDVDGLLDADFHVQLLPDNFLEVVVLIQDRTRDFGLYRHFQGTLYGPFVVDYSHEIFLDFHQVVNRV